jgi:7-cyano-7-deazaguanine synthase in queuosine biosynthesis
MYSFEPADTLRVGLDVSHSEIRLPYSIDDRFSGVLRVSYPFALDGGSVSLLPPIALGVAAFLGQLCLAKRIILEFPSSSDMIQRILPIVEMLYDVRRWWDGLDLSPLPELVPVGEDYSPSPFRHPIFKRACLLWSGGKDSALSTILLQKNGYVVDPIHIIGNARVEESELSAAARLGRHFNLDYHRIVLAFPQFLDIARGYAVKWDSFPHYNAVPFGRDLVLVLLSSLVAKQTGASFLCMGHEFDERSAYFDYQGKSIARCEIESSRGELLVEDYIRHTISSDLRFFAPVGGLPEFRTLYEMFTFYPELMAQVSFCFWGNSCGRCSKCLRYYLVERTLEKQGTIQWQRNPLEGDNCPDLIDYLDNWQRAHGSLYRNEIFYCMARLVERGDIRPEEILLQRFAREIYPHLEHDLERFRRQLLGPYSDTQIPEDFEYNQID